MRIVAASAAAAVVCGGASAAAPHLDLHAVPVAAPSFAFLPTGWRAYATPGELTPRGATAEAFATSWPYRLATAGGPAGSMPRGTVLVQVWLSRADPGRRTGSLCGRTPRVGGHPPIRAPLRLPATTSATTESGDWPEYRIFGRLGKRYNLEVRVDITSRHPERLLALARKVVAEVQLPSWPLPKTC